MPDNENPEKKQEETEAPAAASSSFPLKPRGDVVVTHLDAPPCGEPRRIHPRRPAPIVPERRSEVPDHEPEDK